jgi:hypothetical protein
MTFVDSGRSGNVNYQKKSVTPSRLHQALRLTYESKQSDRNTHESIFTPYQLAYWASMVEQVNSKHTNQKHPLPAFQSTLPIHSIMHSRHHQPGKHTPNLSHGGENRRPFRNLARLTTATPSVSSPKHPRRLHENLLPTTHDINRATIHTRLHHTLEKPHDAELLVRFTRGRTHSYAGPDDQREGQPDAWSHLLDDDAVRDAADDAAGYKEGEQDAVFVAFEIEVFS